MKHATPKCNPAANSADIAELTSNLFLKRILESERAVMVEGQIFNDEEDNPNSNENSGRKKVFQKSRLHQLIN